MQRARLNSPCRSTLSVESAYKSAMVNVVSGLFVNDVVEMAQVGPRHRHEDFKTRDDDAVDFSTGRMIGLAGKMRVPCGKMRVSCGKLCVSCGKVCVSLWVDLGPKKETLR